MYRKYEYVNFIEYGIIAQILFAQSLVAEWSLRSLLET